MANGIDVSPPQGYALDAPPPAGYAIDAPSAPNETVAGKTSAGAGPVTPPPSFKSEPSYAGNDPYEGMPWYLSRNNALGRFSNIVEHGGTFGLNTEVKPVYDMAVAEARRLLGYDTPSKATVSDLVTGKTASVPQSPADVYHAGKEAELAKYEAARKEFGPYVSTAAELLGGFGGIGMGAGQAAARAPGLWNATKGYFGGIGNSAKIGAGMGAVQGATAGDGTLGERLANTAEGAAIGAGTAGALHAVAVPAGAAVGYAANAVRRARNPVQAGYESVAEKMNEGGIDPAALQKQFSPQPSKQLEDRDFTSEHMANIVSRGLQGEPATTIAADYGLHPDTVSRYLNNYRAENPTPLSVMDMAKLQGEGLAGPTTRLGRAAANISPQPQMMQQLADRQLNQPGRANQIVTNATGGAGTEAQIQAAQEALPGRASAVIENEYPGSTFEATAQRLDAQAQAVADQNYRRLHAQQPVMVDRDLADILNIPLAKQAWDKGAMLATARGERMPTFDEMARTFGNQAKPGFNLNKNTGLPQPAPEYPPVWGGPPDIGPGVRVPVIGLDYFQRALRFEAQKGGTEGAAFNAIRQRVLDALDPPATAANPVPRALVPGFRDTMGSYRAGMEGQEALQSGYALKPELSQASREALTEFDAMTPPQQELFRMGFARRMQDALQNPADATAQIDRLNTPGARQILGRVFPPDVAQRMGAGLQGESVTSRAMEMGANMTKNLGAQTRDSLQTFNRMTPEQQDMFRMGFTRKLMDMVSNKGEGADAVKQFSSDAVRQMIRSIYPAPVADRLITQLSREGVTTSSLRDLFGNSTTARQILDQNKLMDAAGAAADVFTFRYHKILENLATRLSNDIGERTSGEILRVLSETDPARVLPILNRLAQTAPNVAARRSILATIDQARTIFPQLAGKEAAEMATEPKELPPAPKATLRLPPPAVQMNAAPVTQPILGHDPRSLLAPPNSSAVH